MKKTILTILFVILFIGNALGEEAPGKKEINGHTWESLPKEAKIVFLGGLLYGQKNGELAGLFTGYTEGIKTTIEAIEKEMNAPLQDSTKTRVIEIAKNRVRDNSLLLKIGGYDFPGTERMVGEVDAFYKTYPSCKSKEFGLLMFDLIKVWSINDNKKTFKEVGEGCLE